MSNSKLFTYLAVATSALTLSSCLAPGSRQGGQGGQGDGSVLASIGGVSEADMARPQIGFWLVCDSGTRVKGQAKKDANGKEYVRFASATLGPDKCGMEIVDASVASDETYEWFGVQNGQKAKGLLYGSNKDVIKEKSLSLKLYKLYNVKAPGDELFTLKAEVTLELAEGAAMPADDKAAASLVCSATEKYPGTYKKVAQGKDATLTFASLRVKDMKAKTCERLVVLVDNKEAFAGDAAGLELKEPKKNETLTFPADNKRYTLKAVVTGDVDVNTAEGDCLSYVDGDCRDRTTVDMPAGKTVAVAKVEGKLENGKGAVRAFYVAMGKTGLGAFEGEKLTVEAINAALKKDATDAEKDRFHLYAEAAKDLLAGELDKKLLSGEALAAHAVKREDVADLKVLHIAEVKAHGFSAIEESKLNELKAARWLGLVKATKDAKTVEFVVGGREKLFLAKEPFTINNKKVFFDFKTLSDEMATASGTEKWRGYALKGAAMAPAECKAEKAFYTAGLSQLATDELKAETETAKALDACEIGKAQWDAALATYTISVTYYVHGWYPVTK